MSPVGVHGDGGIGDVMSQGDGGIADVMSGAGGLNPEAAIAQGEATFNAAYSQSGGALSGTIAIAAGIVSDLPDGQVKSLLSEVAGIATQAAAGAAMGAAIGPWGAAVGAAVGACMALVSDIFSSSPPPPQGEFRSTAEQYCNPAVIIGPMTIQPVSVPDWRTHAVCYQSSTQQGTDQASGEIIPVTTTFAVGWISPPSSTPASKSAAWYIAQACMAKDSVSQAWALGPNAPSGVDKAYTLGAAKAAIQRAWTSMGSPELAAQAIALTERWYGTRFDTQFWVSGFGPDVNQQFWIASPESSATSMLTGTALAAYDQRIIAAIEHINRRNALDYSYYFSTNSVMRQSHGVNGMVPISSPYLGWDKAYGGQRIMALPNTLRIMLAELAYLVTTGIMPRHGADHVALHLVMSRAWLYRQGQLTDADTNALIDPNENDANNSRVIGLIAHRINPHHRHGHLTRRLPPSTPAQRLAAKHKRAAKANSLSSGPSTGTIIAGAIGLAGIAYFAHRKLT